MAAPPVSHFSAFHPRHAKRRELYHTQGSCGRAALRKEGSTLYGILFQILKSILVIRASSIVVPDYLCRNKDVGGIHGERNGNTQFPEA